MLASYVTGFCAGILCVFVTRGMSDEAWWVKWGLAALVAATGYFFGLA